jgi:hypothetical protein
MAALYGFAKPFDVFSQLEASISFPLYIHLHMREFILRVRRSLAADQS